MIDAPQPIHRPAELVTNEPVLQHPQSLPNTPDRDRIFHPPRQCGHA